MKILVCGGRDYHKYDVICRVLDEHDSEDLHVIQGGAKGTDEGAISWCISRQVPYTTFKADWNRYKKSAGPIRNQQMLDEGKPDLVIAFPGGRGTAHMVDIAKKAGVKVIEV